MRRAATLLLVVGSTGRLQAQSGSSHRHDPRPASPVRDGRPPAGEGADPAHAVHEAMSGSMHADPHLRLTPPRTASAADSARAAAIVAKARVALERFKDVRVAEREGYQMFAPNIKHQPVYHFTSMRAAIWEHFRFDPAKPTSLLYKRNRDGSLRLIGAMYTAPKDATPEQLNERVPLGIAPWHLHTNMCVPPMTALERWSEWDNGRPVFGPLSPIATREACDAVDGRFLPIVFNWMVHVNVYEDNPWKHHH